MVIQKINKNALFEAFSKNPELHKMVVFDTLQNNIRPISHPHQTIIVFICFLP